MCQCNGTGGLNMVTEWGAVFQPCPDSNCSYDRKKADREYNEWLARAMNFYKEAV